MQNIITCLLRVYFNKNYLIKIYFLVVVSLSVLISCSDENIDSDAYGNFESVETTISSEVQGKIIKNNIEEGGVLDSGSVVAVVDTSANWLKLKQIEAQKKSVESKVQNIVSQINIQTQQKENLLFEKKRIEKLLKDNAVPTKQLDDINNSISIIDKQIELIKTQNQTVFSELESYEYQIKQVQLQIKNSYIVNPVKGTVLEKYVENAELVVPGKAIYKIANLDNIILRVFISVKQLSKAKINNKVMVYFDNGNGGLTKLEGIITWISSQSEFTPKIIQTRDERQNLVYAAKVKVKNDGSIKIGMPGEIKF